MESFISCLISRLRQELKNTDKEKPPLEQIKLKLSQVQDGVKELKAYCHQISFTDKSQEIRFFKELQPSVYQFLFYFSRLYKIELKKSITPKGEIRAIYEFELSRIQKFFLKNREFYEYYRGNDTSFDQVYFIHNVSFDCFSAVFDESFCNKYSYLASKMLAFEMLQNYLETELNRLDLPKQLDPVLRDNNAEWKASKSDAAEFIIGVQLSEAIYIDNQVANISQLTEIFENAFKIDLKDFKNLDYANRCRKKDQTPFLNNLIKKFNDRAIRLNK
jgi:RteC protein